MLNDAGAKFKYDSVVNRVETLYSGEHKVFTDQDVEVFDVVVSNADLAYSYPEIFGEPMPKKVRDGRYSPSCLIYVVGGLTSKGVN